MSKTIRLGLMKEIDQHHIPTIVCLAQEIRLLTCDTFDYSASGKVFSWTFQIQPLKPVS